MEETTLYWFVADRYKRGFPDISDALEEPNGLLAAGGDLSPERLLEAYQHGIFPWYDDQQPILWWSPNPRAILYPDRIHISRSLKRTLKKNTFKITWDSAFNEVITECSSPRRDQRGTWLTGEMIEAYTNLHLMGYAHSIECWFDSELVGGLYGLAIGRVFFGESMFSRITDASKVCLVKLCSLLQQWDYELIDCQVDSDHLRRMGAELIPRALFKSILERACTQDPSDQAWKITE